MRKYFNRFAIIAFVYTLQCIFSPFNAHAQYSLTGTSYSQNFNSLGSSTSSNVSGGSLNNVSTSLNGWFFSESGTNANTTITAGNGSSATGDTYNFGVVNANNRTLGGLQSGSLNPVFGFYFTNHTGANISALTISYTGKTWRVGATGHQDRLVFAYSSNATSLSSGTWTTYSSLDYLNNSGSVANGSAGPLQTASISNTIGSLAISNGSSFFIRWSDLLITGSNDGLGIDDLTITATLSTSPTMSLSTSHTAAANIAATSTNNIIAVYKLTASNAAINIASAAFVTAGTYVISSDITNFKVWQNSIASVSGATLIGSNTTASSGNTFSFNSGFTPILAGDINYLVITVDVASSPTLSKTVSLAADPVSNFSFSSSSTVSVIPSSGSLTAGNTFSIGNASTGGGFQPGKLAVLRIGDGSTVLSSQKTVPVTIMQFNTTGTNQTGFLAASLPTITSGSNIRLEQNSLSTSEGDLTLSADGNYLAVGGYDAGTGTTGVPASTSIAIVIGRIDVNGATNTTTTMPRASNFGNGNIRSVVTLDGNGFWAAGNAATGANEGVKYTTLGNTGATTAIGSTNPTTRDVGIFKNTSGNNQLYVSSNALKVATVGTGTPTGTGNTITTLSGLSSAGGVYNYTFLDMDASITGSDVLYIASFDAAPMGVLKYYYNSATSAWVSAGSYVADGLANGNIRSVAATVNCAGTVDIYATWATNSGTRPTKIYKLTDATGRTGTISGNVVTVGTQLNNGATDPGTNYLYAAGISFTPLPDISPSSNTTLSSTTYRNITVNSGITVTLGNDITALGDIVVNNGGILDCGPYHIFNTSDFKSTVNIKSGATIKIQDPNGIWASASKGAIQTCSRTFDGGATYIYNGTVNQVTGDGLPAIITGTLNINNTGIAGDNIVAPTTAGGTVTNLLLSSGYLSIGTGNTLNIASGGTVTANGGDIATGTAGGTLNFNGSGTFTTTTPINPYNVYISGGVNFGSQTNINSTLRINSGGFVNTNAPSYAAASILQYYTGGTYGRSIEWNATSGAGYPYNVQLSNNTTLNYPNGAVAARAMEGDLTIDAGSSLYMDYGNLLNNDQALSVNGNVTINGNLSLGDKIGGDINVGGNWTRGSSGAFFPNSRLVNFNGSTTQIISVIGGGAETFAYVAINKTIGDVQLSNSPATDVIINGTTGNVLQLIGGAGGIDLNGKTLTLSASGGNILTDSTAHTITGASGSVFHFNYDGTKSVTSTLGGTLVFGSNVLTKITRATSSGTAGVDFGNNLTTINGTLQMNIGSYVLNNAPTYGTGSLLQYNSGAAYNRTVEWGTTSGPGYPYNVQVSTSGTILNPGGSSNTGIVLNAAHNVTIDAGASLYMDYAGNNMTVPLTVGNDLIINGSLSGSSSSPGDIIVKGSWYFNTGANFYPNSRAVYFSGTAAQSITGTQSSTFDYFINSNTTADVTMLKDVTVNQKITLQTGSVLAINGNILTLNSTIDNTTGNAGTFRGSSTSAMKVGGALTGNRGTLYLTPGAQTLDDFEMNTTGGGNLTLGSNLTAITSFKNTHAANRITLGANTLTLQGSLSGAGDFIGSTSSNITISGTLAGSPDTLVFDPSGQLLNNLIISRTGSGNKSALKSSLKISGNLNIINAAVALSLSQSSTDTLTLTGTITGSGSLTGSSSANLSIGGTTGGSVGTLRFTTGSQTLNTFTLNRTNVGTNAAASLGSNLSVNAFTLNNGILTTGNNLLTWTRTGGLLPATQTTYTPNNTAYKNSYICLCDATGTELSFTSPYAGAVGLKVNNISGTSDIWFPVGVDFKSPNRMSINNTNGTAFDLTVAIKKGDIGNTPKPRVNRIWYTSASATGAKATMKLYFTKQNSSQFLITQDEIETGFFYNDIHLVQKNYLERFTNNSNGADILDLSNNTTYPETTEIYGQYTYGISEDTSLIKNGMTSFTRFSVVNAAGVILPSTITNLKAYQLGASIKLQWTSVSEINTEHYELERSSNAVDFTTIYNVKAKGSNNIQTDYDFTDLAPLHGKNYFRIKAVDKNGQISYTNIVFINMNSNYAGVLLYPNPVETRRTAMAFSNMPAARYLITLHGNDGKIIMQQNISHSGGSATYTMYLPVHITAGIYHVTITGADKIIRKKLIVE